MSARRYAGFTTWWRSVWRPEGLNEGKTNECASCKKIRGKGENKIWGTVIPGKWEGNVQVWITKREIRIELVCTVVSIPAIKRLSYFKSWVSFKRGFSRVFWKSYRAAIGNALFQQNYRACTSDGFQELSVFVSAKNMRRLSIIEIRI